EDALRHQLELDLVGAVQFLEHDRAGAARVRADDLADPPGIHQPGEAGTPGAGVVVDDREVLRALLQERAVKRLRRPGAAKPGGQYHRPIPDPRHRFGEASDALIDHYQNATSSPPLSSNSLRASSGVAISSERFSRIMRMRLTWSALLLASWPRPSHSESSSPTRTLPPMIAPIVTSGSWFRPAARIDQA